MVAMIAWEEKGSRKDDNIENVCTWKATREMSNYTVKSWVQGHIGWCEMIVQAIAMMSSGKHETNRWKKESKNSHFTLEWFFPISVKLLMIGKRPMFDSARDFFDSFSCWCRCRRSKASLTFSFTSASRRPLFVMFSVMRSATVSRLLASMSSMTDPVNSKFLSSNNEWSDNVATWGFDHRSPPSSTSSSNFTHRAVSFHSISSPSRTNSSISENSGWDSCGGWWFPSPLFTSSPNMNWTRCAGGVAVHRKFQKYFIISRNNVNKQSKITYRVVPGSLVNSSREARRDAFGDDEIVDLAHERPRKPCVHDVLLNQMISESWNLFNTLDNSHFYVNCRQTAVPGGLLKYLQSLSLWIYGVECPDRCWALPSSPLSLDSLGQESKVTSRSDDVGDDFVWWSAQRKKGLNIINIDINWFAVRDETWKVALTMKVSIKRS